jgi:hypothetical protein
MDDAFKRLEELVGAPAGERFLRTRAEALAMGATRYFTGKPCGRGHVAERLAANKDCCECRLQRELSPEAKERKRQRSSSPDNKERMRQYFASPAAKDLRRLYEARPEVKEHMRLRYASPEERELRRQSRLMKVGDEILFSINQTEYMARSGRVAFNISPQCPEPTRSKLQALVDQIKADSSAGKQVIGLLRNMRELRKLELAEMKQATETETETETEN